MFKPIPHVDPCVVAFDAMGKISDSDYKDTLIPTLVDLIGAKGTVRAFLRPTRPIPPLTGLPKITEHRGSCPQERANRLACKSLRFRSGGQKITVL